MKRRALSVVTAFSAVLLAFGGSNALAVEATSEEATSSRVSTSSKVETQSATPTASRSPETSSAAPEPVPAPPPRETARQTPVAPPSSTETDPEPEEETTASSAEETEAEESAEEMVTEPTLDGKVEVQHLGSAGEAERYRATFTVKFPYDPQDGTRFETDSVSILTDLRDPRIIGFEKPEIDGIELDVERLDVFGHPREAEAELALPAPLPQDVRGDLITFDTRGAKFVGSATFSAELLIEGRLNHVDEWSLYRGPHTAGELNELVLDAVDPPKPVNTAPGSTNHPRQYWINTGEYPAKIYRMRISDSFPAPETTYIIDREFSTDTAYGDIAISSDGRFIYGISFKPRPLTSWFHLDTYDAETGQRVARSEIQIEYTLESQMNSLSVDFDGRLLVAGPKRSDIYKVDIPRCAANGARCSIRRGDAGIEHAEFRFPRGITGAGDFVTLPNGGVYGLGTDDAAFSSTKARLLYWPPKVLNDPSQGRQTEAIELGRTSNSSYGAGRIDDYLITVDGKGSGLNWRNYIGMHQISLDRSRAIVEREDLMARRGNNVVQAEGGIPWPPNRAFWGATSLGESGPAPNERVIRLEKELPFGRLEGHQAGSARHEFRLGSNPTGTDQSLYPPVVTKGPDRGVQSQVYQGWVTVGRSYDLFEELSNSAGARFTATPISRYSTSLKCVGGDRFDPSLPEIPTTPVTYNAGRNANIGRVTVPANAPAVISCRFVNTPPQLVVEKFPRADREPAAAVRIDHNNRARLTYQIEVTNPTPQELASAPIRDRIDLPADVRAIGDMEVGVEIFGANGGAPISPDGKAIGVRGLIPVAELRSGASVTLMDSVRLQPGERARIAVTIPIEVARETTKQRFAELAQCNYDVYDRYESGGAPNTVLMDGDGDGEANNTACIPLQRIEEVGIQLFKAAAADSDSIVKLDGTKFDIHASRGDSIGDRLGEVLVNPQGQASYTGLQPGERYYLVETQTAPGYRLLPAPVCFIVERNAQNGQAEAKRCGTDAATLSATFYAINIDQDSSTPTYLNIDTAVLTVVNSEEVELPKTGGSGVGLWALVGLTLVGAGWVVTRRRTA